MSEFVRVIANRLREFVSNRRRVTRYPARVAAVVVLKEQSTNLHRSDPGRPASLKGYTRDFSATGLALVMPAIRIGERYLTSEGQTLLITLTLPAGPLQLHAVATRYEHLDGDEGERGYLIGVHIAAMAEPDRALLNQFIRTIRKNKP
ncbi:MAG: PilZ domain-containing protein [Pyrinomonadaceae bacterium]|nr:PilZ domain-containing protein [Pyrinomonadaceae bacterium]